MIFINPHKCCTFVTEKSCLTSNANLCIIQKLKLLPSHYLYWGETLVNRSFLAIRHILAEFFGKMWIVRDWFAIGVSKWLRCLCTGIAMPSRWNRTTPLCCKSDVLSPWSRETRKEDASQGLYCLGASSYYNNVMGKWLLYLAEILVHGLDDDVVERDAVELRIVEGLVLKHPGVERLWHSAANTLYRFASELRVPVWHLMALRRV